MRDEFVLILDSLRNSWFQVAAILPHLVVALLLLIVGWLLARAAEWLVIRVLRLMRLDAAAEHVGVEDFLIRGGVRLTVVTLAGQVVYWMVLMFFAIAMFNVLGLTVGPELMTRLSAYVPDVVAAMAVLVFGSLAARFARGVVEAYLNNFEVRGATNIGMLVQGALLTFVAILALEQLGIAVELLTSAFQLAFGGLCLALALAFGYAGRGWAEAFLDRTRNRR